MKSLIAKTRLLWWIPGSILLVLLIILDVAQNNGSGKGFAVGNNAYPASDPTNEILMNNFTVCDQIYNLGRNLPEYKEKVMDTEDYNNCLRALTNTPSDAQLKLNESPAPTSHVNEMRPRRVAGSGIIIYGVTPRISPTLFLQTNAWYERSGDNFLYVFGGAQRSQDDPYDFSNGAIMVDVITIDHQFTAGGGFYPTPIKAGPVTIVDVYGKTIILAADDGHIFHFDLDTRSYRTSMGEIKDTLSQREAGGGWIVEDGRSLYSGETYHFENQWFIEENGKRFTVFAGQEIPFLGRGVVMVVESESVPTEKDSPIFYFLPDQGAHFRIFEVNSDQITIVGWRGETYQFDLISRQFTKPIPIYSSSDPSLATMEASFQAASNSTGTALPELEITVTLPQIYP